MFIGIGMNRQAIQSGLDQCLLTDAEMALGPEKWATFNDPFPVWRMAQENHAQEVEKEVDRVHG